MMATCRYCGAEIVFQKTRYGLRPCEKAMSWCVLNHNGRTTVILKDGRYARADFVGRDHPGSVLALVPHRECTSGK